MHTKNRLKKNMVMWECKTQRHTETKTVQQTKKKTFLHTYKTSYLLKIHYSFLNEDKESATVIAELRPFHRIFPR